MTTNAFRSMLRPSAPALAALATLMIAGSGRAQPGAGMDVAEASEGEPTHWREAEADHLRHHVQLTFEEDFARAGEAYFSPDGNWIIFQAVPRPEEGQAPDPVYTMYVAPVKYDEEGRIEGLWAHFPISPPGSANTCGWFHPAADGVVIFGSTRDPVAQDSESPGYQREGGRYRWMFPEEMDVISRNVPYMQARDWRRIRQKPAKVQLNTVTNRPGYEAECAMSPDGRFIVYCSMRDAPNFGDLYIIDNRNGTSRPIVTREGYDGGPFFSPEGERLVYRSDRRGDNLLQVFVCELEFDETGTPTGYTREYQLTNDENVNWAPFWHPEGRHVVYTTSAVSHRNYEVFIMDADGADRPGSTGSIRYGTNKRRITHGPGFDGLPAFSHDGRWMMWTSQRKMDEPRESGSSQLWVAEFTTDLDPVGFDAPPAEADGGDGETAGD